MKKLKLITVIIILNLFILQSKVKAPVLEIRTIRYNTEQYLIFKMEYDNITRQLHEFNRFLDAIGKRESNNNWKAWNRFGYMGEYQFGKHALIDVGYGQITFKEFVNNPSIFPPETQRLVMVKYLQKNNNIYLNNFIDSVLEKNITIRGTKVTRSGLLAGAHLGGARGVKNLMLYNKDKSDAFGSRISDYVVEFSGYDFDNTIFEYILKTN
jgi:hypothetical protein